ncbi:hypothetical protein, partial [Streptomyces sp. 8L]|uniref:hypothetical protein n=1 Tax=Streptomyces sp. 8L TaxID=2877242 RepID=UPI001CD6803F
MTSVGGTTRRNSSHNSSGTNRSARLVMLRPTNDQAKGNDVLEVISFGEASVADESCGDACEG